MTVQPHIPTTMSGLLVGTDQPVALELAAGSGPGRGQLAVAAGVIAGSPIVGGGEVSVPISPAAAVPLSGAPLTCSSIIIQNHDGAEVNGSAGLAFFGKSGLTLANGQPVGIGGFVGIPADDANTVMVLARVAGVKVRWTAFGS